MSTQNATITESWSKIADTADDPLLIQAAHGGSIQYEIATVATETAPTVAGHTIYQNEQAMTRSVLGAGHVYARLTYSSASADAGVLIVTGSSETLT